VFRDVVEHMLPDVKDAVVRRLLLIKAAIVLLETGELSGCLAALDKADEQGREVEQVREMTGGLLRAVSLLRLGKTEEAPGVLKETETWHAPMTSMPRRSFYWHGCGFRRTRNRTLP
jgi:hypothetical protein